MLWVLSMATTGDIAELIRLLQEAKRGNRGAFAAVYEAYYLPVFRYCNKRLKHLPDAEDIAQQVFLRLYNSRSEFVDQNISPLNYLFTIARHALADFWRTQKNAGLPMSEDLESADESNSPEAILSQVAADQLLQLASPEEKIILTLRIIDGRPSHDVALQLNKSEAAVRQIQCRALKKIREYLLKPENKAL